MCHYISQTITVSSCQSDISNQCRIKTPCITGMAEKEQPAACRLEKTPGGWGGVGWGGGGGGAFRVSENPNLQILPRQNACQFSTMSERMLRGWQTLHMRNSGRLLLFPGGLSWCTNQHSCLHPIECHGNTTNDAGPLQHRCDFRGKLIIHQILWHGTSGQRHGLTYTRANP